MLLTRLPAAGEPKPELRRWPLVEFALGAMLAIGTRFAIAD